MQKTSCSLARTEAPAVESARSVEPEIQALANLNVGSVARSMRRRPNPSLAVNIGIQLLHAGIQLLTGASKRSVSPSKIIVLLGEHQGASDGLSFNDLAPEYLKSKSREPAIAKPVRALLKGKPVVARKLERRVLNPARNGGANHAKVMTVRQREVLKLLAEGRTMKQAASVLKVTPRTIAFHKGRIKQGFGLKTNADIVRFAIRERVST
jgi:DNA-binding NarL/FixJ family response regulator